MLISFKATKQKINVLAWIASHHTVQNTHRLTSKYLRINISVSVDAGCPFRGRSTMAPVCSRLWAFDTCVHSHIWLYFSLSYMLTIAVSMYLGVASAISHRNCLNSQSCISRLLELGRRSHHICGCCVNICRSIGLAQPPAALSITYSLAFCQF